MGAIAGSNMEVGEINSNVQVKAMGNLLREVMKRAKERKKFHNQTIGFWNKYINAVGVKILCYSYQFWLLQYQNILAFHHRSTDQDSSSGHVQAVFVHIMANV